ncbi:bifunctional metallophosphatase/5'-nucleotidase [Microtetraspora sp. NBRC 16547]|uniref:bifunctional metallophosphatase/5'-nucleotidase n=1 Tax=Microtetraspora sp. NBRC 16547 TaxID=3030993 RepID=UPI0024A4F785|nr:bifunctional metallophosphatase/5'-nucleotidase [Microtetraspora sp. NBRC 16547]GLW96448.1 bifunctional metallophosphatase/5'-nucleotidase [Microtetraspora sp. NBRC 16547]
MTSRSLLRFAVAGIAAATGLAMAVHPASASPATPQKPQPASIRLLTVNDFHGNLETPTGSSGRIVNETGVTVQSAGGAAYLATAIKQNYIHGKTDVVAAGDLIGASPLVSAAYHDEPTVQVLGELGLNVSSVGNHEFDEGLQELLRIQNGGCHPIDGCSPAGKWKGAKYDYIAANVVDDDGKTPLPPIAIRVVNGVKIGYIGLVTKTTPSIVTPAGIAGLTFQDEVQAGNRAAAWLKRHGVNAMVALVHEGDSVAANQSPDACPVTSGAGKTIATNLSADVDLVVMGHSHQAYICTTTDPAGNTRYFTQGSSFGRVLTQIDFQVDRKTGDVIRSSVTADNKVVAVNGELNKDLDITKYDADRKIEKLVSYWQDEVSAKANAPVGKITAEISNVAPAGGSGETALGDVIADAQLAAAKKDGGNADIALMNPGGVRALLTYPSSPANEGDGVVTYGEAFAVQPFNNLLQAVTLTGAQLKTVLEQQFTGGPNNQAFTKILQPSSNLTYSYNSGAPWGSKISDLKIGGVPVTDGQSVRVAANNFLVSGGDAFAEFTKGTDLWTWDGGFDVDAFTAYLTASSPLAPPALTRITKIG